MEGKYAAAVDHCLEVGMGGAWPGGPPSSRGAPGGHRAAVPWPAAPACWLLTHPPTRLVPSRLCAGILLHPEVPRPPADRGG